MKSATPIRRFDRKTVMMQRTRSAWALTSRTSASSSTTTPKSLDYYQRPGAQEETQLVHFALLSGDVQTARFLIQNGGNEDLSPDVQEHVREASFQRLRQMTGYCKTADCLRGYILSYLVRATQKAAAAAVTAKQSGGRT